MKPRKFAIGQRVTVVPNKLVAALTGGTFTVVRALPEERGVWQYRIESIADGHERIVYEIDLGAEPPPDTVPRGVPAATAIRWDFSAAERSAPD